MNRKIKNILIIVLFLVIIGMAIGYAALSQLLTINGTANISANWDIKISNIAEGTLTAATSKTAAVVSNSMSPYFNRGDVCIIKKITNYSQIKDLKEGDIVEYQLNNIFILHRIIDVSQTSQGYKFETKGDNNKDADLLLVDESQIAGLVTFVVPYLGYPSVWFSEWINKK